MASSSSSLSSKYDVFLSYRGQDTRDNIVTHLDFVLQNKKIQTFINRGCEISPAVIRAIKGCKISVIILSDNYGESRWCLDELVKIIECRNELNQIVIPVFYNLYPYHLLSGHENFGIAFDSLLKNYQSVAKKQIWRNALKTVANLSGLHSLNIGSDAILVNTIVDKVLKKLEKYEDRGLVGINSKTTQIISLLRIGSPEFRRVGIWGMGGIGKTTIAKAVFKKISCKFEGCCFLENVREKAKKDGLISMRDYLISELLKDNKLEVVRPHIGDASIQEKLEIHVPHIGDAIIKDILRRTRVLVVLDDVENSSQLDVLIGARGTCRFGPGSRVMVSTRDKHVLNAHDITDVYEMKLLHDNESLQLFHFHALRNGQPADPYLEISKRIVECAKGLPLALKLFGTSLRGKIDLRYWVDVLKRLKKVPNMRILDVLKKSYDTLDYEEKDIFLDIACFFKGTSVDTVENVLGSCHLCLPLGMQVLIEKSLINISDRNISIWDMNANPSFDPTEMHELVQEMGWNIVTGESKEVGSRSRLWRREDVSDVLTRNTGTEKIKSIFLDVIEENEMELDPEAFEKMYNLKFLKIMDPSFNIQFPSGLNSLPDGLKYLYWQGYPLECLPPSFNPNNLVELNINGGHLKRLWSGRQNLYNLKALCIRFCTKLIEIPDLLLAKNLEKLCITSCESLVELPSFIQYLKKLIKLDVSHCSELIYLPNGIGSLRHLHLNGCPKITKLPYQSKNIIFLELNGTLVEEDQPSIALFTQLASLVLWESTDYQKSDTFLEKIKALTPSYCRIRISETKKEKSEYTYVGMDERLDLEIEMVERMRIKKFETD